jgi:hypothetical protein
VFSVFSISLSVISKNQCIPNSLIEQEIEFSTLSLRHSGGSFADNWSLICTDCQAYLHFFPQVIRSNEGMFFAFFLNNGGPGGGTAEVVPLLLSNSREVLHPGLPGFMNLNRHV